ncbi:MAG: NADH-quinone oxidoreductase subunit K, partial [Planctomycetota bacterium]
MSGSDIVGLYNYWIVIFLMMTGFYIVLARKNLIKSVIGLNIFQTSVFLLYITMGKIQGGTAPIIPPDLVHFLRPLGPKRKLDAWVSQNAKRWFGDCERLAAMGDGIEYVYAARWDALSNAVQRQVKLCLLDLLATGIVGSKTTGIRLDSQRAGRPSSWMQFDFGVGTPRIAPLPVRAVSARKVD